MLDHGSEVLLSSLGTQYAVESPRSSRSTMPLSTRFT
jgi:hypothetical protein